MVATERLLQIEERFGADGDRIVVLALDGETVRLVRFLNDGINLLETLEPAVATAAGTAHAAGANAGTSGLHLAAIAAGVRAGDLVITTPFSFIPSANSILSEHATPSSSTSTPPPPPSPPPSSPKPSTTSPTPAPPPNIGSPLPSHATAPANLQPATFNLQPPPSTLHPATSNLQPSTSTLHPPTSNLQPLTCNLQPATFNLQPSTFNLQPST